MLRSPNSGVFMRTLMIFNAIYKIYVAKILPQALC